MLSCLYSCLLIGEFLMGLFSLAGTYAMLVRPEAVSFAALRVGGGVGFDKGFPAKEKKARESQRVFEIACTEIDV